MSKNFGKGGDFFFFFNVYQEKKIKSLEIFLNLLTFSFFFQIKMLLNHKKSYLIFFS